MTMDERIPGMSDKDLAALHANAVRLAEGGASRHKLEAERILPLINAELAERRARAPAPAVRAAAKKVAAKAPAKPRASRKKAPAAKVEA